MTVDRTPEAWTGAVEITAAIRGIDPAYRLEALAIACDAWVRTNGTLEIHRRVDPGREVRP